MSGIEDRTSIIRSNLDLVKEKMANAAERSRRNIHKIKLVVVTKGRSIDITYAAIASGAMDFGENYPEDAINKINASKAIPEIKWHMIGHLQSRKIKYIVDHFDYMHSLDSVGLSKKLNLALSKKNKILPALLEFNVGGEESKYGWNARDDATWPLLADQIAPILEFPFLDIRGLMTMPPIFDDPEKERIYFTTLRKLRDFFATRYPSNCWEELSMGTSADYEVAIEEGATFIRVGQAILGKRPQPL